LHSSISGLQELFNLTKQLHDDFVDEAQELEEEVQGQIDTFADFQGQEDRIKEMETRIKQGREKADGLRKRLDKATRRVEKREKELQVNEVERARRKRMLWMMLGLAIAVLVVVLAVHFSRVPAEHKTMRGRGRSNTLNTTDIPVPEEVKSVLRSVQEASSSAPEAVTTRFQSVTQEDERLRLFDEL